MERRPPADDANQSGEERIIAQFRALANHPGAFGLLDDAAVLAPPDGCEVVLKADAIVGGVHFFPDDPPDAVARKALRVNLSDLAAKGADPAGFLLSLALPDGIGADWISGFARGLGEDAEHYGCPLLGGDTDRSPGPVFVSIAAFGFVPREKMVLRSGARSGDAIVVTGTVGDAALGLHLRRDGGAAARWGLTPDMRRHLEQRYLLPQPRSAAAHAVRAHASAAMDVSDGLVGDLAKLCRASGVAAEIAIVRVPLSDAARHALAHEGALIEPVLAGGDDYEILCTMPPDRVETFRAAAAAAGVAATEIGRITARERERAGADAPAGQGVRVVDQDGREMRLARTSYSHF